MNKELILTKWGAGDKPALLGATVHMPDMGEPTVETKVCIDGAADFSSDWELAFRGERYIMPLREPQGVKENTRIATEYTLTFQHWVVRELQREYFRTIEQTESGTAVADKFEASLRLNLRDFCEQFNKVLRYYFGERIKIDLNPDWRGSDEAVTVGISYSYLWDVLIKFYELYKVRWEIVGGTIRVGYPAAQLEHYFEYGFEGGLLKVERQVQDDNIRNKIYGRGGDKNLPFRYFKDVDPQHPAFAADPDWVPELANIAFDGLRSKEFRDYVRGWNNAHHGGAAYFPKTDAYIAGQTDEKFDPWEFVKDDASIAKYGVLTAAAEKNEEIYPSLQGVEIDGIGRVDEVVAVQTMTEQDDILAEALKKTQTSNEKASTPQFTAEKKREEIVNGAEFWMTLNCGTLSVNPGKVADFFVDNIGLTAYSKTRNTIKALESPTDFEMMEHKVWLRQGGIESTASGIPAGVWTWGIDVKVRCKISENNPFARYFFTIGCSGGKLIQSEAELENKITFDVWIKNIWMSAKRSTETEKQYAERVWLPILGDKEGSEAKVVFTSGELAVAEDYEFTIVATPEHDESKNHDGVQSHWKLTLQRSTADYESTGKYVPNQLRNGKAGDRFVFTGIELPHQYVLWAEGKLQQYKQDELDKAKDIKPTYVVGTDRIRMSEAGEDGTRLIDALKAGASVRLLDKRLIGDGEELLYIKELTITYRESTETDAALNPDVEMTLSGDYEVTANPVATLQGSIEALSQQIVGLSNLEQLVRVIGDKLYLRKIGANDRSAVLTEFANIIQSYQFRQGMIGGRGWGFYRDANGDWVLETDRLKARKDFEVNNLVVNQITARGGMIVESAASMEVIRVDGDKLYFDQKQGSVPNLFKENDIILCHHFDPTRLELDPDELDPDTAERYYKAIVTEVGADYIEVEYGVNFSDRAEVGDVVVQWGNTDETERQYVIVRDVVGGGYERFIEGLNSINADGEEYFFVGKQNGSHGEGARFYLGNTDNFIEYKNGKLTIKADIDIQSTYDGKSLQDMVADEVGNLRGYSLVAEEEITPIECDADGNIILTPTNKFKLYNGKGELVTDWTLHAVNVYAQLQTNQATKTLTLTSLYSNTAKIVVEALFGSVPAASIEWTVYKVIPGAPGVDASGYSMLTNANVVTRTWDGDMTPRILTCTTQLNGVITAAGTLKVKLQRASGDETLTLSRVKGTGSVEIDETVLRAVFSLYVDNAEVARKSVAVIYDAAGAEQQMRNHALRTINPFVISGFDANRHTYNMYQVAGLTGGDTITVSFDYDIADVTMGSNASLLWQFRIGNVYPTPYAEYRIPMVGSGHYSMTWIIPTTYDGSDVVGSNNDWIRLVSNNLVGGTITIKNMMVQKSKREAPWSINPNDPNYLMQSLQENTSISGGLILTSVVEVGNSQSGTYTVRAGMSGVDDAGAEHGGVVFWAGGTHDAAEQGNSTYVINMDGTGHAAGGTVQFRENSLGVGQYVNLTSEGLDMTANGVRKMRMGDYAIGDAYIMNAKLSTPIAEIIAPQSGSLPLYRNTTSQYAAHVEGLGDSANPVWVKRNIGTLPKGSKVTLASGMDLALSCSIPPSFTSINKLLVPQVSMGLYLGDIEIASFGTAIPYLTSSREIGYTFNGKSLTLARDYDNLELRVKIWNGLTRPSDSSINKGDYVLAEHVDIASGIDGVVTATIPESNLTTIGMEGVQFSWGNTHQYQKDGFWGVRCGDGGIKVDGSVIYVMINGVWQKLADYIKSLK